MRVLIVSSEWPTPQRPHDVPFLVEQVEELRRAGVEVEVFPFRGRANPLRYAAAWRRLRAAHALWAFDIVHAHFGQAALVALPCPVPLIVTFHGSDLEGLPGADGRPTVRGRLLKGISRFTARRAAKVIVVSERLRAKLPAGVDADVIPCGIDLEAFAPRPHSEARRDLGLPAERKLVLFVGDPANPVKRHALAAESVSRLDPALGASLVTVSGRSRDEVPSFMSACDALLVTSRHEGSPMVVKEALACGLPVVSVDVGDVAERVRGVRECRVCASDEPTEIARCLGDVLRVAVRADGGRAAVAGLGHGAVTPRLLELYRNVVRGSGVRGG